MWIFIRALQILLAIAFVMLTYYVVVWVLGLLGVPVPDRILTIVFVIIGLGALLAVLTGSMDRWWTWRPGPPAP